MGFDLHGLRPYNETGEYFRNNVWWWRPLWNYVSGKCIDILSKEDIEHGSYTDGWQIPIQKAREIAKRLKYLISCGEVEKYEKEYTKEQEELPDIPCDLCEATGERYDEIVQGKCNKCDGKGTVRPWTCSYPFSEDNVKEFAKFADESGGFDIC